jgi:hypothetical protein
MQRTADFHDQIADARPPEAVCPVHHATALHTAVHVLDADTPTGNASIRRTQQSQMPQSSKSLMMLMIVAETFSFVGFVGEEYFPSK